MAHGVLAHYHCSMIPAEHPDRSATLLWFPRGRIHAASDFEPHDTDPRAERYWFRHEAIIDAMEPVINASWPMDRDPWIKFENTILDADGISREYRRLKDLPNA